LVHEAFHLADPGTSIDGELTLRLKWNRVIRESSDPRGNFEENAMAMREMDMDMMPDESMQSMQMQDMEQEPMQNPVEMIKQDHRKVEDLFEQFEGTQDKKTKLQLTEQICGMLMVHATLEEELLYPMLKEEDEEVGEEAEWEHELVKFMINEIKGVRDKRLAPMMKVLKELVEHHVEEEESEALPELEGKEELREMMPQIIKRREQLEKRFMQGGGSKSSGRGGSRGGSKTAARSSSGGRKTASSKRGGSTRRGAAGNKELASKGGKASGGRSKSSGSKTSGSKSSSSSGRSSSSSKKSRSSTGDGNSRSAAGNKSLAKKGAKKSAAVRSGKKSTGRKAR
jgi:hemerythrin superfamily protein